MLQILSNGVYFEAEDFHICYVGNGVLVHYFDCKKFMEIHSKPLNRRKDRLVGKYSDAALKYGETTREYATLQKYLSSANAEMEFGQVELKRNALNGNVGKYERFEKYFVKSVFK